MQPIIDHHPPVIQKIREIQQITAAEDIEFTKLRAHMLSSIDNMFIYTADAQGLSCFEEMLGIIPAKGDDPESRRARVLAKWFDVLPYNLNLLERKMEALCKDQQFEIQVPDNGYEVMTKISIEPDIENLLKKVQDMLEEFLPVNMYYQVIGNIKRDKQVTVKVGNIRGICVKIKAEPEKRDSYTLRDVHTSIGIATLNYVRAAYQPQKE